MDKEPITHPDKEDEVIGEQNDAGEILLVETGDDSRRSPRAEMMARLLKRFSITHVFLLVNTLAIVALVVSVSYLPVRSSAIADYSKTGADTTTQKGDGLAGVATITDEQPESASWKQARVALAGGQYGSAFRHYSTLHRIALNSPDPDIVADLFQVRMAQCLEQLAKPLKARKLFQLATASRSPVIRGVANYHIAMAEERGGAYLRARRRAYLALASLAALTDRLGLETNCAFLIARVLTGRALSFYGKSKSIAWGSVVQSDPFSGLDEPGLRKLLTDGFSEPREAILGPKVQLVDRRDNIRRWTATCLQCSLDELLSEFATKAKTDLLWGDVEPAVRNRPVNARFRRVSGQRFCELAVGSAGLIVRFIGDAINIKDPAGCESLTQQRTLLVSEAILIWRRLFLRVPRDKRVAEGHFALALLQECSGDALGAIGQYQSTARNFSKARVASEALLRCARLRILELRDYSGACKDLLTLLDVYPDDSRSAEAYASLGEATMKSGRPAEALQVFKKLFFLSDSIELRLLASLGAGNCLYQLGKYDAVVKWLNDHMTLARKGGKSDLCRANLLLGRCHSRLGDTSKAVGAFKSVLAFNPSVAERIEVYLALAGAWRKCGDLTKALAASFRIAGSVKSDLHKSQLLLITAGIYRDMGLTEKAASYLKTNILKVSDPQLRARLRIEQARCYYDAGCFSRAHEILTEAPEMLASGDGAQEAACDLAETCLRIGQPAQAAIVAARVLKSSPEGPHAKRAREIMAEAYLDGREYEKAATALSGIPISELGVKP